MSHSDSPRPYRVSYSRLVLQEMQALGERARERGIAVEYLQALRELERRLRIYPRFGEPLIDLTHEEGQVWIGTVPPIVARYAVLERHRLVMVAIPIMSLRRSGF